MSWFSNWSINLICMNIFCYIDLHYVVRISLIFSCIFTAEFSENAIIGLDNGLLPVRRQAIILINVDILLIGRCLGTDLSGILIRTLSYQNKNNQNISSAKWCSWFLSLNMWLFLWWEHLVVCSLTMKHTRVVSLNARQAKPGVHLVDTTRVCFIVNEHTTKRSCFYHTC